MNTKLFVGSLAYSVTDEELKELFETIGAVQSAKVIIDRQTNRSKGIGFVEMDNSEDAQAAIQELHGKELNGRTIVVSEARPQENRSERRPHHGGGRGHFDGPRSRGPDNRQGRRY